jgi:predicted amidohydrolase
MNQCLDSEPDLICIPETFLETRISNLPPFEERVETIQGSQLTKFQTFAKEHSCNIVCPIHTKQKDVIYNSAVVIDRNGDVAGYYHKIRPTTSEIDAGVTPGSLGPICHSNGFRPHGHSNLF